MSDDEASPVSRRRGRDTALGRFARTEFMRDALATVVAASLRFVNWSSRTVYVPRPTADVFADFAPLIVTAWHGQAFMLPFVRPEGFAVDVLASRHADGELIARALVRLGCGVIRGSGAPEPGRMHEKGAVASFRAMKAALDQGRSVALTADFLKTARRQVGPGIIALARLSGRPIMPVAFVSSRRREIGSSWDRTTISLPFGRAVCVIGEPLWVPREADEALVDAARADLEARLNDAAARAAAIADRRSG